MAMTENINLRNSKFSRCHASFYNKWCVLCMENCSMKEFPFHMQACNVSIVQSKNYSSAQNSLVGNRHMKILV